MCAWVATRPGVTSTLVGATKLAQLESNLASLDVEIPPDLRARLDEASRLEPAHPYMFFDEHLRGMINGGVRVAPWKPAGE